MRKRARLKPITPKGRRSGRALKAEALLALALVVGLVGAYLQRHPITLGAGDLPQAEGEPVTGATQADVLLVVPDETPAAESFEELDAWAVWHNTLYQEIGPYRVLPLGRLGPESLRDAVLVVVPAATAERTSTGQIATLESWVEGGGRLLVEMPTGSWQPLSAVSIDPNTIRATRRITAFDGALVRGDLRDDVIQAPLLTVSGPIQVADVRAVPGMEVLLEVDGLPGLTRRTLGRGEVLALYFDLGRAVLAIQQGLPDAGWEITRPSAPLPPGFTRTSCLVADDGLHSNPAPSADLLEHQILAVATSTRPMPRVWLFPQTYAGAFAMTHSGMPDVESGRFLTDYETERELPSTVFTRFGDAEGAPGSLTRGALLAPPGTGLSERRPIGLFGFHPFERVVDFEDQVERLRRDRGPDALVITRLSDSLWHPRYGDTFRALAALGVDVDSSYGAAFDPTELDAVNGYNFGTGLPFWPLDRNGQLLPILEIPFVLHDGLAFDRAWASQMLDESALAYNQLIVADFRTGTMQHAPRAEVVTGWRESYSLAVERGLWLTDLDVFARFWRSRGEVQLSSRFETGQRRLSFTVEIPEGVAFRGEAIRPSVAFESHLDGRPVERVTRNGQDVPFAELGRSGDGVLHLFALPHGRHHVEVTYQGPIELE